MRASNRALIAMFLGVAAAAGMSNPGPIKMLPPQSIPQPGKRKRLERHNGRAKRWNTHTPGWTVAEGKRRARKARNRLAHKRHVRG
jgi:hypothetical protein